MKEHGFGALHLTDRNMSFLICPSGSAVCPGEHCQPSRPWPGAGARPGHAAKAAALGSLNSPATPELLLPEIFIRDV